MCSKIRQIIKSDTTCVLEMMRDFYNSPWVHTNGSEDIFMTNINACISDSPYVEGYVFDYDGDIQGYAMVAKSYSTEFGKACIWIEDLYIKEQYRGLGLGSNFLRFLEEKYPDSLFRLEVEEENTRAINVYKKSGFDFLPYMEMKK